MDQGGVDADRHRHGRVERGDYQLLVEQPDEQQVEEEDRAEDPYGPRTEVGIPPDQDVPRGVGDLAVEDALLVEVDLAGPGGNQHHAKGEQGGEDDADRGVLGHLPAAVEGFDEQGW